MGVGIVYPIVRYTSGDFFSRFENATLIQGSFMNFDMCIFTSKITICLNIYKLPNLTYLTY